VFPFLACVLVHSEHLAATQVGRPARRAAVLARSAIGTRYDRCAVEAGAACEPPNVDACSGLEFKRRHNLDRCDRHTLRRRAIRDTHVTLSNLNDRFRLMQPTAINTRRANSGHDKQPNQARPEPHPLISPQRDNTRLRRDDTDRQIGARNRESRWARLDVAPSDGSAVSPSCARFRH
jgi:hypothetical protein